MSSDESEDVTIYHVVINHEEQYSIWPEQSEPPLGWKFAGKSGSKAECLGFIKEVWTDMRPLSLRKKMAEAAQSGAEMSTSGDAPSGPAGRAQPSLVDRLCSGLHSIEVSLRPNKSLEALQECIDRGYVHIRFADTQGGTELGLTLDKASAEQTEANALANGTVKLVGRLVLDEQPVICIAEVDLATLSGQGRLERTAAAANA